MHSKFVGNSNRFYSFEKKTFEQNDILRRQAEIEETKRLQEKSVKISICKSLFEHVCERIFLLQQKCVVDFKTLTDISVMEFKKDSKIMDSDFNDILDRIVKLSEAYPSQYMNRQVT